MSQVVVDLTLLCPLPGMLRVRSAAAHWLPRTFLLHGNLFSLFCSPHSSAPLDVVNKFMQSSTATRCNIDGADMSTLTVSYPPHGCMIYSVALENAHTPCVHTLEKGHVRKGGESCTHLSSFWAVPAKLEQAHVLTLGTILMASNSP